MKFTPAVFLLRSILAATSVALPSTALHAESTRQPPGASAQDKKRLFLDLIEKLMGCGLTRADATALAQRIVNGDAEAVETARRIEEAVADLHRANASAATIARVAKEIFDRRLTDGTRGGAVQSVTGRAVIETVLGKEAAKKLPPSAGNRVGEIARSLLDAMAELDKAGVPRKTKEYQSVLDTIIVKGLEGRDAIAAVKVIADPFVKAAADGKPPPETTPLPPEPTEPKAPPPGLVFINPDKGKTPSTPPATATPPAPADQNKDSGKSPAPTTPPSTPAPGTGKGSPPPTSGSSGPGSSTSSPSGTPTQTPTAPGAGGVGGQLTETDSYNADGNLVTTYTDANGKVVQTIIMIDMTGGTHFVVKDGAGNVVDEYFMRTVVTTPANQGADASHTNPTTSTDPSRDSTRDRSTGGGRSNDGSGGNSDDSDDDKKDDGSSSGTPADPTLTADEKKAAEERRDSEDSPETVVVNPLHPDFQNGGGSGFGLYDASGGRLGGQDARNALAALYHRKKGKGGTVDPSPDASRPSGVLLTPEEKKNAARSLDMARSGGVTDPANTDKAKTTVTARDLKDLNLRGTGGAKGPSTGEKPATPPKPQDPKSPVAPPKPIPAPVSGATKAIDASKVSPAVGDKIKTEIKAQEVNK